MKTQEKRTFGKRALAVGLSLSLALSMYAAGGGSASAQTTEPVAAQLAQSTIQGSAILHCFDWSYNAIRENLPAIAAAGYTAVQTSPVQKPKDYNAAWTTGSGQWWKLYQPLSFSIADGTSWLGTKAELKALCDEAEDYNIKVVVDVVANHLANNGTDGGTYAYLNSSVDSDLKNSAYFHTSNEWAKDDNRWTITQQHIGMPDLNTSNSYIQQKVLSFLKECADVGVDGFRFDAAKHIELPTDDSCASQFWPTVINGIKSYSPGVFCYGEILGSAGTDITNYTTYFAVTENYSSDYVLNATVNKNASGAASSWYSKGATPANSVLWAESHDTYMGSSGSGGISNTSGVDDSDIIKTWAMVGSRANASSLFFARPNATMGLASTDTTWKSDAVAEINKFKNYFNGQSEYLASSGSVAYNERGTSGVVIAKLNGAGSVSLTANKMAAGTYTDQITGNKFTVSGGKISGTVGSTGVAVVYTPTDTPVDSDSDTETDSDSDTETDSDSDTPVADGDYYLFGWINGANYACEGDAANMGNYVFTNGKLTTSFNEDSYVAVKKKDNAGWYMTNGWLGTSVTSATLYNTSTLGTNANKLYVPGGVTVTFTLVENSNDTFTLSYKEGAEKDPVTFKGHDLVLSGQLGINFYTYIPSDRDISNCSMTFSWTSNGTTVTSTVAADDNNTMSYGNMTLHRFTCYPKTIEMGETITAVFSDGEDEYSETYSIEKYFKAFEKNISSYSAKDIKLVRATAAYCFYMQSYLNELHNQSNTPIETYTSLTDDEVAAAKAAVQNYTVTRVNNGSDISTTSIALRLKSETEICIAIIPKSGYSGTITASLNGSSLNVQKQSDGTYLAVIKGIPAHKLTTGYPVVITTESGSYTITVSALSYARSLFNSSNTSLNTAAAQRAMAAMYYYYDAAYSYKNS